MSVTSLLETLRCAVAHLEAEANPEIAADMFGGEPDPVRAMAINRNDVLNMLDVAISMIEAIPSEDAQ